MVFLHWLNDIFVLATVLFATFVATVLVFKQMFFVFFIWTVFLSKQKYRHSLFNKIRISVDLYFNQQFTTKWKMEGKSKER